MYEHVRRLNIEFSHVGFGPSTNMTLHFLITYARGFEFLKNKKTYLGALESPWL